MYDIPIELICKYYARAYTVKSGFYREINRHLRDNKIVGYLPYIKVWCQIKIIKYSLRYGIVSGFENSF